MATAELNLSPGNLSHPKVPAGLVPGDTVIVTALGLITEYVVTRAAGPGGHGPGPSIVTEAVVSRVPRWFREV